MVRAVNFESPFDRVSTIFGLGGSTMSKEELRKLERRSAVTAEDIKDKNAHTRIGVSSPSGLWSFVEPTSEKIRT